MTSLATAHGVDEGYRHVAKHAQPASSVGLGAAVLKWYDLARPEDPVPAEVRALARGALDDAARVGELELGDGLGFVILHRCGAAGFHFLLVGTWRNDNELWETVWAKHDDADPGFHPWVAGDGHRPTFCVWELGVVAHERVAWAEYLGSPRDATARRAYLGDTFEGPV
ncbi:MAG TPA: hypothetical protein VL264_09190 [Gaiella sp.]|nr:hypothetical protein [Gaiella sp.]